MNPLQTNDQFYLTLANPNPTSGKNKQGAWYRVSFELTQDEWQNFMDAELKGMVIECACQVSHTNERDPDTIDAFSGKTDKEAVKGGGLSIRSDALARDPDFHAYIESREPGKELVDTEYARAYIRKICGVESRAELDHLDDAAAIFKGLISDFVTWNNGDG